MAKQTSFQTWGHHCTIQICLHFWWYFS